MNLYSKMLFFAILAVTLLLFPGAVKLRAQASPSQQKPAATQEEDPGYTEEEYDAFDKANQETDLDKKVAGFNAFIEKYPSSKLMPNVVASYQTLMYDYSKNQKFDKLEPVAEQWLKTHPNDLQTMGYIAESAQKLGHDQKYIDYAEKIYAQKPSGNFAYTIAQGYKKLGNDAKYGEWVEKVFTYPEFAGEYALRYSFVQKYVDEKNYPKAAEAAQLTLKALDAAKKPDATPQDQWTKELQSVRRACDFTIGLNNYEKDKYTDAIKSFTAALKAEKFAEGFYYVGMCQWKLNKIEEAMLAFARAEKMGGAMTQQSKDHLEQLYKGLHNNMTIGIEKVYKKAAEEPAF